MGAFGTLERVEVRALLPLWAAVTGFVVFSALTNIETFHEVAAFVYAIGSFALGAHAIGHDYMHRTLPLVLSQPVSRTRIFVVKMVVLAFYVTTLAGAAFFLVTQTNKLTDPDLAPWMIGFIWLCSLLLAPVHAMLTRTTIGGAVFTITVPAMLALTGALIGSYRFDHGPRVDDFQSDFFWTLMPAVWAIAAVSGWWLFGRLQLADARRYDLYLPSVSRSHARKVRRPLTALIHKELRLHGLALAIVGIYLLVAGGVWVYHMWRPGPADQAMVPVTVLSVVLLALVVGATASAEERHLGTRDGQLLLPIPAWQQWLVKVAVAFGITLTLAALLPTAVAAIVMERPANFLPDLRGFLATVLVLTALSLYVSSLSTTAIHAVVLSVPLIIGLWWMGIVSSEILGRSMVERWRPIAMWTNVPAVTLAILAVVTTLASLGQRNHRSAESGLMVLARQAPVLVGVLFVAILFLTLFV